MENLNDYLNRTGISESDFGKKIGATQSTVNRYRNGERQPRIHKMLDIKKVTGGSVTPESFAKSKPRGKGLRS